MTHHPLVSIIIPTYNRAHLIGETLDSVLAQTYTNWECIIVDDGSTDHTDEVVGAYVQKDARFKYFHRPDTHLPGGNGARNYGFLQSKGEYINWFDSDDLMYPEKLEKKVQSFKTHKVDLVVSKSEYFNSDKETYGYNFISEDINFESFSMGNVTWITNDFMIRREIALQTTFNENLRAGQEYNYVCKVLLLTDNVFFINEVLTNRRYHEGSIGVKRRSERLKYFQTRFLAYWTTYNDIKEITLHDKFLRFSLLVCISCYFQSKNGFELPPTFNKEVQWGFSKKSIYFYLAKYSNFLFGKYHFFYNKLKNKM